MISTFIKTLSIAALVAVLSACGSSSGSSSGGTRVSLSAAPSPANNPAQGTGAKTFATAEGHSVILTSAYLVLSSATIETSCGATFSASLQGMVDFLLSPAAAHTTSSPTSTGVPYVINLLDADNQASSIGSLSPPTDDYCGVRLDLLAADDDALNLPAGSGEPDLVGKTIHIEGTYNLAGGGSGGINISTGASLANRNLLLSALMIISADNLDGQIDVAIQYDTWFDTVDLATLETETTTQTLPTDTNVARVLNNISDSIHQR